MHPSVSDLSTVHDFTDFCCRICRCKAPQNDEFTHSEYADLTPPAVSDINFLGLRVRGAAGHKTRSAGMTAHPDMTKHKCSKQKGTICTNEALLLAAR